jgi:hypothetical protein
MNATSSWVRAVAVGVMVWGTVAATGCGPEVIAEPAYYPPPAFIASTSPVYYQGRPSYYYNNRWYYRSGGGWGYYRNEPTYLYQRRVVYGPPAHQVRPGVEARGEVRVR